MYNPGPEKKSDLNISLHRNENLFIDQDFFKEFVSNEISNISFNTYPDSQSSELREAISKYHNCSPEEVYVGNGADGVLADIFNFLRDQYDEIGLQPLTYQVYPYLCARYNYQQKSLRDTSQIWVLDSPNSINGETFDFTSISNPPKFLIWDNVYGEFDMENSGPNQSGCKIIRINSFSKFFSLASLRIGYCVGDAKLISMLMSRKDIFNVNAIAQKAAIFAINHESYFRDQANKMLFAKQKLIKELAKMGFLITPGKANFVWITHSHIKMKFMQEQLDRSGILVRRFEAKCMENYLRITVPPEGIIDKLMTTLHKMIKKN